MLIELWHLLTNEQQLLQLLQDNWLLGTLLIALVIFVETGVVVMPFLPGDSLLFTAGALMGVVGGSPVLPMLLITAAAIAGDACNYAIGRSRLGQQLLKRGWVKPQYIAKTHDYFERYGGFTIFVGRFVPIVRTLAPFLAGLSGMAAGRFLLFNITGGITWCAGLILAGYWLGSFAWVRANISLICLGIVALSVLPLLLHGWQAWRAERKAQGV
ncbi:VTT domain-containing protein [Chitinimonas sp.]|uniref:VTT domain-containing protein n=1 Tax=Chitinimonas sp. TaxID=1934313 RepID=UPI002F949205